MTRDGAILQLQNGGSTGSGHPATGEPACIGSLPVFRQTSVYKSPYDLTVKEGGSVRFPAELSQSAI